MQLSNFTARADLPEPNYVNPATQGNGLLIVNIVGICLAFLAVSLRLYTRYRITCTLGFDDALIVLGLAFAFAMAIVTSVATQDWGANRHIWDIPVDWLPVVAQLNLVFQIMFSWASSLTKISLLWFCRRLVGASKGNYVVFNHTLAGFMILVFVLCVIFTFLSIFQCSPVKALWDVNPTYPYKCIEEGHIIFSASVINIFTDFVSTILPMSLIWSLRLPTHQRLVVISIFGLGILVNAAGVVRTIYVWKAFFVSSTDRTWMAWIVLVSASLEINLGLICTSAPALRPLVVALLPHLLESNPTFTEYKNPNQSQNFLVSAGLSRNRSFKVFGNDYRQAGYESDHLEIMRTVELETRTDPIIPFTVTGNSESLSDEQGDTKLGPVFTTGSEKSRGSLLRNDAPRQ
ncbi:hypothetical protein N7495_001102 [Penicillium taxi]|uniref:uncharacterized protein n=1 Tax=Penicillium taxi TaxID=168475 RepID=UPI002544D724|nr:uncharacterized protein N7495_001102 [Penicillium taxi]KAJ5908420.1 hypothetical protein N7495_001102 [Penicillium taxi]